MVPRAGEGLGHKRQKGLQERLGLRPFEVGLRKGLWLVGGQGPQNPVLPGRLSVVVNVGSSAPRAGASLSFSRATPASRGAPGKEGSEASTSFPRKLDVARPRVKRTTPRPQGTQAGVSAPLALSRLLARGPVVESCRLLASRACLGVCVQIPGAGGSICFLSHLSEGRVTGCGRGLS